MALPFGLRRLVLTPYTDQTCTELGVPVRLPVGRTLSFEENGDSESLRGDDEEVASHEAAPTVSWEIEAGGIDFPAYAVLSGASVTELVASRRLRKKVTNRRPYFMIEGQVIDDAGGDLHAIIYRAKCTDTIGGEFGDQQFFLTSCSGTGYGCLMGDENTPEDPENLYGVVYDFVSNDEVTAIPMPPTMVSNLTAGATTANTQVLTWDEVVGENEGYDIQRKLTSAPDSAFAAGTPATVPTGTETVTQTGLTAATAYDYRVRAKKSGMPGAWSSKVSKTTTA
jgi:hypothetical protein